MSESDPGEPEAKTLNSVPAMAESDAGRGHPGSFSMVGTFVFALCLALLGGLEAWREELLPGLHPVPSAPLVIIRCLGGALLVLAIASLFAPVARWATLGLAGYWVVFCAIATISAAGEVADTSGWVSASEAAVFATTALAINRGSIFAQTARVSFGLMLVLFGMVHLSQRELISSLVPSWIPYTAHLPWITGGVCLLAGLAIIIGFGARSASVAVGFMFASWLPLVHASRLAADPSSMFEWTFALTAAALVGVALQVAAKANTSVGGVIEQAN